MSIDASPPGVVFPGQVTDAEALGRRLDRHRDHPLVATLARLLGGDPATADHRDTRVAQPCTYVAGLVEAWDTFGPDARHPVTLGHSLGEITAMAYAGAIDPYAGLGLVFTLGEVGHEQYARRPSALVAVIGPDRDAVEWQRRLVVAGHGGVLEQSGYNDARQTVLCGDEGAVDSMIGEVRRGAGSARRLAIRGAYHSSLMVDVLPRWRQAVDRLEFRTPRIPLLSTVDVSLRTGPDGLAELLARWLVLPVRWEEAVVAAGAARLWNAGPGDVLARIARRHPTVTFVDVGRRVVPV